MIDYIKSYKYGISIKGHIDLKDDLTAAEIYEKIYHEIMNIEFAAITSIFNGGENIVYPDTETERH